MKWLTRNCEEQFWRFFIYFSSLKSVFSLFVTFSFSLERIQENLRRTKPTLYRSMTHPNAINLDLSQMFSCPDVFNKVQELSANFKKLFEGVHQFSPENVKFFQSQNKAVRESRTVTHLSASPVRWWSDFPEHVLLKVQWGSPLHGPALVSGSRRWIIGK